MTDARYVFTRDVAERKTLCRSSYAKKNGSKSHKCTLPSDQMTAAQRKRRNSEVKTYKLNEPMSWKDFKYMPADLRLNYLRKLIAAYDVGGKELAEMFGVAPNSLSAYCIKQFPGEPIFSRSHQTLRGAGRDKWDAFIAGETYADEAQTPAPAQEAQTQAPTPAPKPEAQTSAPATAYRPETMIQGSVLLQGEANDILKAIRALLADGKAYRVQLGFEMQAEEKGAQQPIED